MVFDTAVCHCVKIIQSFWASMHQSSISLLMFISTHLITLCTTKTRTHPGNNIMLSWYWWACYFSLVLLPGAIQYKLWAIKRMCVCVGGVLCDSWHIGRRFIGSCGMGESISSLHASVASHECMTGLWSRSKGYACHGPQVIRMWYFNLERPK